MRDWKIVLSVVSADGTVEAVDTWQTTERPRYAPSTDSEQRVQFHTFFAPRDLMIEMISAHLAAKHYKELEREASDDSERVEREVKGYLKHGADIYAPDEQALVREVIRLQLEIDRLDAQVADSCGCI